MGMTVYYSGSRQTPFTDNEKVIVKQNLTKYSVNDQIEIFLKTGDGWNGEPYSFETNAHGMLLSDGDTILRGSASLPYGSNELTADALWHFCDALSDLRRSLTGLEWEFRFDEIVIEWDEAQQAYAL